MPGEAFGIEKEFLQSVLTEVGAGKAQLPEFQRDWVWPDQNIISLLASVSLAYPVGTIMMLRTGGGGVRFKQRPIQGVASPLISRAERLILDGQQRLTALYQALMLQTPVKTQDTRKKPVEGWLYIDIQKALDPEADREEAIRLLSPDRVVRNFRGEILEDYSTPEREYAAHLFPLNRVFESDNWQMAYQEHWDYAREKILLWNAFRKEVIERFTKGSSSDKLTSASIRAGRNKQIFSKIWSTYRWTGPKYQLPIIELGADTQRQAVCQVFEKVNTGGVTLTVFELLTATFAADEFDLRKDWEERQRQFRGAEFKVLGEFSNTDFLQVVTLLATLEKREAALNDGADAERAPRIGCRRSDMLALELGHYQRWAPEVVAGLKRAAQFLHTQHFFDTRFLPYGSQLVPLAAIFAALKNAADNQGAQEKIAQWFWCGVMGELYGGAIETRFSRDLPEVIEWVQGGAQSPRTVVEALFSPSRLLTLRTRNSAAYKGVYALLLRAGAVDWRTGQAATNQTYFDNPMDIHHIFPKSWCQTQGIPADRCDSIINKTPLSSHTNRVIGGRAPSDYLERVANGAGITAAKLDQNVLTHVVDPTALRQNDFEAFFTARTQAILQRIESAMGKAAVAGSVDSEGEIPMTYDEVDLNDDE